MAKKIIRLLYRKVIDANAQKAWEQHVFNDSYAEFLLQAQFYNQEKKYNTFAELLTHVPDAEKLHFLVSPAITGYLKQLNGKVPDILNSRSLIQISGIRPGTRWLSTFYRKYNTG